MAAKAKCQEGGLAVLSDPALIYEDQNDVVAGGMTLYARSLPKCRTKDAPDRSACAAAARSFRWSQAEMAQRG